MTEPNEMIRQYLAERKYDPRSADPSCRAITEEEHAGWRFFQLLGLGASFVSCLGVAWGMAGLMQWTLLALLLTWLFWISTFLFLFVYIPHVAWWAYKRGVFDA